MVHISFYRVRLCCLSCPGLWMNYLQVAAGSLRAKRCEYWRAPCKTDCRTPDLSIVYPTNLNSQNSFLFLLCQPRLQGRKCQLVSRHNCSTDQTRIDLLYYHQLLSQRILLVSFFHRGFPFCGEDCGFWTKEADRRSDKTTMAKAE